MPCYNPLKAWRSADPESLRSGKHALVFQSQLGLKSTEMTIPCGQCAGCRLERARQWAVRCMHESSLHDVSIFVTLTYDDEHLPPNGSLRPTDMQLFLKRLRKRYGTLRFYQCGEYGDQLSRPHHHAIIFGLSLPDIQLYRQSGDFRLYVSPSLTDLWGHGFVVVADVSFDSVCYVTRYVMKKITGNVATEHYNGRLPEYTTMSRRPGIGRLYYDKYKSDLYNYDQCVVRDKFVCKPPKYYDKLYDIESPEHFKELKDLRKKAAAKQPEKSYKRLETLEKKLLLTQKQKKRMYESHE